MTSDQYGDVRRSRTTASWTAPAAVAAWAQSAWASRCSVENVEKIVITQSHMPAKSASDGQRQARHGSPPEDDRPDDRLGEEDEPEEEEAGREQPVGGLSPGHPRLALARSRSSTTPGATRSANASPTSITSSGGWTSQSHRPFPSG